MEEVPPTIVCVVGWSPKTQKKLQEVQPGWSLELKKKISYGGVVLPIVHLVMEFLMQRRRGTTDHLYV